MMRFEILSCYLQAKYSIAESGETSLGRPRIQIHKEPTLSAKMDGRRTREVLEEAGEKIYD